MGLLILHYFWWIVMTNSVTSMLIIFSLCILDTGLTCFNQRIQIMGPSAKDRFRCVASLDPGWFWRARFSLCIQTAHRSFMLGPRSWYCITPLDWKSLLEITWTSGIAIYKIWIWKFTLSIEIYVWDKTCSVCILSTQCGCLQSIYMMWGPKYLKWFRNSIFLT